MRTELPAMIDLAERLLNAGEPGTLATLFASRGSTYRLLGSMMVSGPPGTHAGGVSGGCLEEYVVRHGRALTQRQPAEVISFAADPDADDGKPVLGCGGSIEVLVERLTPAHLDLLRELRTAYDADEPSLLVSTLNVASAYPDVRRHWFRVPRAACPTVPSAPFAIQDTITSTAWAEARSVHGKLADDVSLLATYVPPVTRLVVFGAGDDVKPLADTARALGWHVTIADRRARVATSERFPTADRVLTGPWEQIVDEATFTPRTALTRARVTG